MKQVRIFAKVLFMTTIIVAMSACSKDDYSEMEQNNGVTTHTIKMNFEGGVIGFDQQSSSKATTRGTSTSWNDGDKIYITFYNGTTIVPGEATYAASSGWSVSYDGDLATGTDLKCEARYFINATFLSASLVSLNSNSEIYEDTKATYSYSNGSLTVQATLLPKTGRLRFKGTSETKIYTTGISVYTTFSPATNTFSTSNAMLTSTVGTDGYTPYIYGYFTDSDRSLGLVGNDYAFTRACSSEVLKTGESGYMAIPSEASHNNWRSGLYVKASGVEFKMIPVAGYSGGFFMIGETEVTTALYNSVNGTSSTSIYPISDVSYSSVLSFIEKLNNTTKLPFSLPTSEQWQYAAKGGNRSQGYIYSGSNTPDDVAWYSANTTAKQKVKTKAPNELGIYDMSGNVSEYVSTIETYTYGSYTKYSHRYHGGSFLYNAANVRNTAYTYYHSTTSSSGTYDSQSSDLGFRLIMTLK